MSAALRRLAAGAACGACLLAPRGFARAPDWLQQAAARPVPTVSPDAPAVVLLEETVVAVDDSGTASVTHRVALRILKKSGARSAACDVIYIEKNDRVRSCDAWIYRDGEVVKAMPTREWLDLYAGDSEAVISEYRRRLIGLESKVEPGDVVGFETRVDSRLLFAQLYYPFGSMLPAVRERYQVKVPAGFRIDALAVGPPHLTATTSPDGSTRTWEMADRPYREVEEWTADGNLEEPRLYVSLAPPAGSARFHASVLRSWADAVAWELRLVEGRGAADGALVATAQRLTAGCPDVLSKIRALAGFAQQIRYVSTDRDIGKGFGYCPRPAAEVLAKGYGDCKDKANLLCALLRQVGIVAHSVGVSATNGRHIEAGWPSLYQFNHAIVAIEVDDSVDLPPTVRTTRWGRLLFFDPTDKYTPFGDLPWELQGTKGELVAPGVDELIELPRLPEDQEWAEEQHCRITLDPDGSITGKVAVVCSGQIGARMRATYRDFSERELRDKVTRVLTGVLGGVNVAKVTREDRWPQPAYAVSAEFTASRFSQPLRGGLLMVRLDVLGRQQVPQFSEPTRRTRIRLQPINVHDEVTLDLSKGFAVAELPPKATLETPYGRHERSFEVQAGTVVFRRTFALKDREVPAEEYAALRKFLADAAKADRAAVLLRAGPMESAPSGAGAPGSP